MKSRIYWTDRSLVVFGIICLIALPAFFNTYRLLAFTTAPRDDYAPFLLWFTSHKGAWPGSPFGYRVLSVIPAIPLYWILPLYRFSLLPEVDPSYLKALEALAAVTYLASAGSATVAFNIVLRKLTRSRTEAALAAALTIVLSQFNGVGGVDPVAIFIIFTLFYFLDRPAIFCPVFLLAPFTNEKILFFFVFLMAARIVFVRGFFKSHTGQIISFVAGVAVYIAAIEVIRLPGNEGQIDISRRIPEIVLVWTTSFSSLKGIVLNVFPTVLFTLPCVLWSLLRRDSTGLLETADCLVPLGLLLTGLTLTEGYQVGRIVSYSIPLTVISSILLVGTKRDEEFAAEERVKDSQAADVFDSPDAGPIPVRLSVRR